MQVRAALVLLAVALAFCGCGVDSTVKAWEQGGEQVDTARISYYRGGKHCGWQDVTFINMDWPLDDPAARERRQYVWDPKEVLDDHTLAESADGVDLPGDAQFTGYSSDLGELWLAPSDQDSVAYVVSERGDEVRAWPRTDQVLGCD